MDSATPVTGITFTVTEHVAVFPPSEVLTVIVAVPALLAVTVPLEETVATSGLLDAQVTSWSVASEGLTVAMSWELSPLFNVREVLLIDTPVT